MAGTTVTDRNEVRSIFIQAGQNTGLEFIPEQYQPLRGLSKREVFVRLWTDQSRHQSIDLPSRIEASFAEFRRILEEYYRTVPLGRRKAVWNASGGYGARGSPSD